jgi:hypothetical protein
VGSYIRDTLLMLAYLLDQIALSMTILTDAETPEESPEANGA